ncbi:hypothetical protein BLD44_028555 [Mastigocladus laminosus UU774]|nr:hypothetical protein BLD44_028555 [Mastigocladus laminosus UU774]
MAINYPVIDPRNEEQLIAQANQRVFTASNGVINEFSDHSPVVALNQGLAFIAAELLWYANKLPEALLYKLIELSGFTENLGTKATATLRFTLSINPTTTFTIPAGFEVLTNELYTNEQLTFVTLEPVVILPGNTFADVQAECETIGTVGNVPARTINVFNVPYAYLSSIDNAEPAIGGTDAEDSAATIERALANIRRRNTLFSLVDYEEYAEELLGLGSRAVAVPLLAKDKETYQLGSVHVFVVNADGSLPSQAKCSEIESTMSRLVPVTTSVYVSPVELVPVELKVIVTIADTATPQTVSDEIYNTLADFVDPTTYPAIDNVGINELEYVIRSSNPTEILNVGNVTINGNGTDLLLPNDYKLPLLDSVYVELISNGTVYDFGYGQGSVD